MTRQVRIDYKYVPILIIVLATLLQGYYNALIVGYSELTALGQIYPRWTFLFRPEDLHADLLKYSMSFLKPGLDVSSWPEIYQKFYLSNPYTSSPTANVNFPGYSLVGLSVSKLIASIGPSHTVTIFYSAVFFATTLLVYSFCKNIKRAVLISLLMMTSYVLVFILSRGHIYSYITGLLGIYIIRMSIEKNDPRKAILPLAIIFQFYSPLAILGLLIFTNGLSLKKFAYASLSAVLAIVIFITSFHFLETVSVGFTLKNFVTTFFSFSKNLTDVESHFLNFNNSASSAIYLIASHTGFSSGALKSIFLAVSVLSLVFSFILFLQKKLDPFVFSFTIISLMILNVPVFATYHLLVFYFYILFPISGEVLDDMRKTLITMTVVCLLVPKNYLYFGSISLETVINPVLLLISVFVVLSMSIRPIQKLSCGESESRH